MRYNERIRELREEHFLTQQTIADLLHIGQRTYSDYESGKTRIPVDSLLILARHYDVSMDYISGANDVRSRSGNARRNNAQIAALESALAEKDLQIAELQQALSEARHQLAHHNDTLEEHRDKG